MRPGDFIQEINRVAMEVLDAAPAAPDHSKLYLLAAADQLTAAARFVAKAARTTKKTKQEVQCDY